MEITEIKQKLLLCQVLHHYHLKPDRNMRLCCPFHPDKTPSMQVYYKTHTAYCFSTNCPTHGKSIDVIDFLMYKEKINKHEAILKAKSLIQPNGTEIQKVVAPKPTRTEVLTKMFTYFKNAVHNSKTAKEYLEKRCLDFTKTEVGYNSGQFHHGTRKDENLIKNCVENGLLLDLGNKGRTGNPAYKSFGKWCIVFGLRDRSHQIVGLYFRSTLEKKDQRHFYLRDRQGLYPGYPPAGTKRLILTESIIDAASLLEEEEIRKKYKVLSLYGTNGLTKEHQQAIKELNELEEVILFLNGDDAGKKAVEKYGSMLKNEYPQIKISQVEVPENEDVNSLLEGHSAEILIHLINTRKEYGLIFSSENQLKEKGQYPNPKLFTPSKEELKQAVKRLVAESQNGLDKNVSAGLGSNVSATLDTCNPYNLKYSGKVANYQIKGFKINQLDSLKITLQISST